MVTIEEVAAACGAVCALEDGKIVQRAETRRWPVRQPAASAAATTDDGSRGCGEAASPDAQEELPA